MASNTCSVEIPALSARASGRSVGYARPSKVWIDLDNSPHVPFFVPIIDELQKLGHDVVITARDCFQVRELADLFKLKYTLIGHHYGKHTIRKLSGLIIRALQLMPTVLKERPTLALSHCSRSQLIVSSLLRIPSLQMGDYEFSTAWRLLSPTWLMGPDVIPRSAITFCRPDKILTYPGIKEDVYVPRFTPDPSIRWQLQLPESDCVVTLRPPADEAHYHNPESTHLFDAVISYLSEKPHVKLVVLPRNLKQANNIRERWSHLFSARTMLIPERAVNGLNLIWHSDLVISAGGTMNREAAALGVPVYSIFRGPIGSVDRYLSKQGRLVLLESFHDIPKKIAVIRRTPDAKPPLDQSLALDSIVNQISGILDALARSQRKIPAATLWPEAPSVGASQTPEPFSAARSALTK